MGLKIVLRWPGTRCPPGALTGDEILDAYLRDLDARLLGSGKVRLLTLAEIRDHLEEAKARAIAGGADAGTAASEAVRAIGDPAEYAGEQRRLLRHRFLKNALIVGIALSLPPCVFFMAAHSVWELLQYLAIALIGGASGGLLLGTLLAYFTPDRRLGRRDATGRPGGGFVVAYPQWERWLVCLFWLVMAIYLATVEKIYFAACVWALVGALQSGRMLRVIRVMDDGFLVGGLLGQGDFVNWQDVTALGSLGDIHPWIPQWSFWGGVRYLKYARAGKRPRRIFIWRDMIDADRFFALAEEQFRRSASGGAAEVKSQA